MTVRWAPLLAVASLCFAAPLSARAQSSCDFIDSGNVLRLTADCVTDSTIDVPDGYTLDGAGFEIAAVDTPGGRPFRGAVVAARAGTASIINTTITTVSLSGGCPAGENRLRGIYFDGASGEIIGNTVIAIFRGPLPCDEGLGIEVRSVDAERGRQQVTIRENVVDAYQKGGIVVHGHVDAVIQANLIGVSVSEGLLGVNGVQVGPFASARIEGNTIEGAFTGHVTAGSAILIFDTAPGSIVDDNRIVSAADVGIHVLASGVTVSNNVVQDLGPDGLYDIAIVNRGADNLYFGNTIRGFQYRYLGVDVEPPGGSGQQVE